MLKILSLFSGIGAFEKAFDRLGVAYALVNYCEIDKYASKSYAAIHGVSEALNLGDVTKVDTVALPKNIDFITYGFPCQDISLAGKQKGMFNEDGTKTRSGLFFEALRIIKNTQPRVAIAENVKNLTSKKFAEQFKTVLESLEEAGYNNYWQVLNAKDYGIPQNRERVFIVSVRKDIDKGLFKFPKVVKLQLRLKDMLEDAVEEKYFFNGKMQIDKTDEPSRPELIQVGTLDIKGHDIVKRIYSPNGIAPTLTNMQGGNRQPKIIVKNRATAAAMRGRYNTDGQVEQKIEISDRELANAITTVQKDSLIYSNSRVRKLTALECWRLMGFNDEDYYKAEQVNSNTQLYKQAGNSIVVNVLEAILAEILEALFYTEEAVC